MADVQPETVRWLWHPYIALGKLTILEGDPGIGKSTVTCALASAVTNGKGFPGADTFEPGNVLMLSAEDGLADTLRPRLDAVEADTTRVMALNEPLTFDTVGLLKLEGVIIEYAPKLVTIDPLFAYTGGKTDIHRANECRAISAPLAAIAERHGCAIIAVRHLGKSRGGGHALNAGIGSIDFAAAARSVLLAGQDPDDPKRRAIVQTKNNLAPMGEAVGYVIEGGRFFWTGTSTLTAGRILSPPSDEDERGPLAEAKEFLITALSNGPRDCNAVRAEARDADISGRTLSRAKSELRIKSKKVGMPGTLYQKWVWSLPAEECRPTDVGNLRATEGGKDLFGSNLGEGCQA
jgi:putative DNA primase/helicase